MICRGIFKRGECVEQRWKENAEKVGGSCDGI